MKMVRLEPHFLAAFSACEAACQLLDLLPASDLIEDMRDLLHTQHELFQHMTEGKHFGTDALNRFITYSASIAQEAVRLREEKE